MYVPLKYFSFLNEIHFGVSYLLRIALCLFEECMLKENKRLFHREVYIITLKVGFFIFEIAYKLNETAQNRKNSPIQFI